MIDVTISKKDFVRLLTRACGVVDRRSTMPALQNVMIDAEPTLLSVSGTDMYQSVLSSAPAEGASVGSICLPAKDLLDRVKALPDGPVRLTTKGTAATVKAGSSPRRYTMNGHHAEDRPQLPVCDADAPTLTLPAATLAHLFAMTSFSMSTDETRPHVNSTLFEVADGIARMVTTDGHRLSKVEVGIDDKVAAFKLLIPFKAVAELSRLANGHDGDAVLRTYGPNLFVDIDGAAFSVKLTNAQFPPYNQVIPAPLEHVITVGRAALQSAIHAVSVAADSKTGGIKFAASGSALTLTTASPDSGDATDEVPIAYNGPDVLVGCNGKYLLDVLGALDCDEVAVSISGDLDPVKVEPVGGDGFVAVVMPMRI